MVIVVGIFFYDPAVRVGLFKQAVQGIVRIGISIAQPVRYRELVAVFIIGICRITGYTAYGLSGRNNPVQSVIAVFGYRTVGIRFKAAVSVFIIRLGQGDALGPVFLLFGFRPEVSGRVIGKAFHPAPAVLLGNQLAPCIVVVPYRVGTYGGIPRCGLALY